MRGMTREGYLPLIVHNVRDVARVDSQHVALISATVGKKKKIQIIAEAQKRGVMVLNVRDAERFRERVEKEMTERKKEKSLLEKKRKEKVERVPEKTLDERSTEEKSGDKAQDKEAQRREAEKAMLKGA